ncbi:MAG: hypothetical protein AAGG38_11960 [Planctomycetota bacterium]
MPASADLSSDVETLKSDLAQIRDDLKVLASNAVESGKDKAEAAKDVAKDKYNDALDSVETFVKDKPVTSLGIAFAAGLLASLYLKKR